MSGISDYSTNPDDNDSDPPHGAPEGMLPGKVNDVVRQIMADIAVLPGDAGSALIGFLQSGTGAVATDLQTRGQFLVYATDYGADTTGTNDSAVAFGKAAQAVLTGLELYGDAGSSTLARPLRAVIRVPQGTYKIGSMVDTGNRDVVWLIDNAAQIDNPANLNGTIIRDTRQTRQYPLSTVDFATVQSIVIGGDTADRSPSVTGLASPAGLATYSDRDQVGLFVASYPTTPLIDVDTATYTATTVTVASPSDDALKQLRVGMIIDTKHATKYSGVVASWSSAGGNLTITVQDAWYLSGGSSGTPADGTGIYVNVFTQGYCMNLSVHLLPGYPMFQAKGSEIDVYNTLGDPSDTDMSDTTNRIWGHLVSVDGSDGYYKCQAGYMTMGPMVWGYAVRGYTGVDTGFEYYSTLSTGDGYVYRGGATAFSSVWTDGNERFNVSAIGNLKLGTTAATGTKTIDFFTSGNSVTYDGRLQVTGGTSSNGNATAAYVFVNNSFSGNVYPTADNVVSCGKSANRWTTVYAATGTINTSDRQQKQDIEPIPEAWLDAWGDVQFVRYRWKDAVQAKGNKARWHVGLIAQQIDEAFKAHGIDAFQIGLLCKDPDIYTITTTEKTTEKRPVMEDYEAKIHVLDFDNGRFVRHIKTITKQRPKLIHLPVVDETGKPVFENGVALTHPMEVMADVEVETVASKEVDNGFRWGVRYDEALILEAAWLRRELSRAVKEQ